MSFLRNEEATMEFQVLLDQLWVVFAASLVFFMQAGFSMVESGLTRAKNSINVAIKNLTDLGVSMLVYWAFGFALMFGNSRWGLFGSSLFGVDPDKAFFSGMPVFFLFQVMFCSTSATIVSGAVAERMRYSAYIIATLFLSAFVYPVFGHWAWGGLGGPDLAFGTGWLARIGFVDFAGSTVVHSVGGYVALAALLVIGPRKGRFAKDGRSVRIPASNIPLAVAGVIVLWFGWIGFNGGSTLAMIGAVPGIIVRTCLAAGAGMLSALFVGWLFTGVPEVGFVMNGSLAGLVAITANCHAVSTLESVIIGAVAGVVMLAATIGMEKAGIDDAVGAVPVHLAAGIWGTLAVGIFGDPALLGVAPVFGSQLLAQGIGSLSCFLWAFTGSLVFFWLLNRVFHLRVSAEDEETGLNVAEHGASTDLVELFATMHEQAESGDLSLRLPVEPFTEVGQIARMYNRVIAGLEQNTIAREEFTEIFTAISDGLFLVDRNYRICPNYSSATSRILCSSELSGKDVRALFETMLSPDKFLRFTDFLEKMFSIVHHERAIKSMNPLSVAHFRIPHGYELWEDRFLEVQCHRIFDTQKKRVLHVLFVIRDHTREAGLARQLRNLRAEVAQ